MPGTTAAAVDVMAPALIGAAYTAFNNANARLGVGTSTTAHAVGQTDLLGTSFRKAMDATFPTNSAGTLTFKATFATTEANFAWAEFGTFNAGSGGTMLQRKVQALGTKPSSEQWVLTVTVAVAGA